MTQRTAPRMLTAVVALGALLFATGCDNPIDPDAAKVNGVSISREELFDQVDALAGLPNDDAGLATDSDHAYASDGVANVLSGMIADRIYQTTADRAGLQITDADMDAAREQLGDGVDALPADVADTIVRRTALRGVVNQYTSTQQWWNDDDIARYHAATRTRACVRHILVDTEEEADDIVRQLEAGADFERLAREHSTDQGSAENGGSLGCNPRGWFIAPLEDAIEGARDGELVGPVASGPDGTTNWHVILVDEAYRSRSLDETRDDIEALFSSPDGWVQYVLRTTDVQIDPRFGTWDANTGSVTPPAGAQPRS